MQYYLESIDQILSEKTISSLFGGRKPDIPEKVIALNPSDSGLGINAPINEAVQQFEDSKIITKLHVESIIGQNKIIRITDSNGLSAESLREKSKI